MGRVRETGTFLNSIHEGELVESAKDAVVVVCMTGCCCCCYLGVGSLEKVDEGVDVDVALRRKIIHM